MAEKKTLEEWGEIFEKLRGEKEWQTLIRQASQCIKEWPDAGLGYFCRGKAKDELGRHEEAIKDYDMAIELEPDFATAYNNRGTAKDELGRHEEAIKDYNKAIELEPNDATAYNNRGSAKYELGRYEEAIKDFDKAITLEPENQNFHNGRAIAFGAITAAETRETLEKEYRRQLEDVQSISTITENFRRDIEYLEYSLYGDPRSDKPPSGGGRPSCKLHFIWSYLSRCFSCKSHKRHIGWDEQASIASGRARWYLMAIAFVSYGLFFYLHKIPVEKNIVELNFLDFLQVNAFVLLLYSPFLLFNKHLSDKANRRMTLVHAVKRDSYRLSFWAAQATDDKSSKRSRLAPAVLKDLQTNSAVDIYFKMTHNRRAWRGMQIEKMPKDIPPKIAARLDDIEEAIKKTSP